MRTSGNFPASKSESPEIKISSDLIGVWCDRARECPTIVVPRCLGSDGVVVESVQVDDNRIRTVHVGTDWTWVGVCPQCTVRTRTSPRPGSPKSFSDSCLPAPTAAECATRSMLHWPQPRQSTPPRTVGLHPPSTASHTQSAPAPLLTLRRVGVRPGVPGAAVRPRAAPTVRPTWVIRWSASSGLRARPAVVQIGGDDAALHGAVFDYAFRAVATACGATVGFLLVG